MLNQLDSSHLRNQVLFPRDASTPLMTVSHEPSFSNMSYIDLGHDIISYIFSVCQQRKQSTIVKTTTIQILQRFMRTYFYDLNDLKVEELRNQRGQASSSDLIKLRTSSDKPWQVYILAAILIASKSAEGNAGMDNSAIPLKKLHKFAGYSFTDSDLTTAELDILSSLNFNLDFRGQADNLYERMLFYVNQVKNLITHDKSHAAGTIPDEQQWLLNQCIDILEMVYFSPNILTVYTSDELACSIIQASMIILSKHSGTTPVTIKLHCISKSQGQNVDL